MPDEGVISEVKRMVREIDRLRAETRTLRDAGLRQAAEWSLETAQHEADMRALQESYDRATAAQYNADATTAPMPTGQWVVWWDEDYWAAQRLGKRGLAAAGDTWMELLPKMLDAEQAWDAGMEALAASLAAKIAAQKGDKADG